MAQQSLEFLPTSVLPLSVPNSSDLTGMGRGHSAKFLGLVPDTRTRERACIGPLPLTPLFSGEALEHWETTWVKRIRAGMWRI